MTAGRKVKESKKTSWEDHCLIAQNLLGSYKVWYGIRGKNYLQIGIGGEKESLEMKMHYRMNLGHTRSGNKKCDTRIKSLSKTVAIISHFVVGLFLSTSTHTNYPHAVVLNP